MNRRDFIKTGICLGCAGALVPSCKNAVIPYINTKIQEQKFVYRSKNDLPKKIRIEACNLYQMNSPECSIRKDEEEIKKNNDFGYLKFSDFKKFIDDNDFEGIDLSNKGEIFLNPELDRIIKYSYGKYIPLYASTEVNLNTISEKMAETIVKYQLQILTVSIDAVTPDIYAIRHKGGDFNKVIENIKMINKYKKIYNSKYPKMIYKFAVFGHNEHEIELAKKKAKELDMEIKFEVNSAPEYSPVKNKEKIKKLTGLYNLDSYVSNFYSLFVNKESDWFYCTDFFNKPQINFNGQLLGCCMNITNDFGLNVFEDGLINVLNNEKIIYAKRMLTDFSVKPREDIICSDCIIYKWLKDNNKKLII